jgi:hypothetical protein
VVALTVTVYTPTVTVSRTAAVAVVSLAAAVYAPTVIATALPVAPVVAVAALPRAPVLRASGTVVAPVVAVAAVVWAITIFTGIVPTVPEPLRTAGYIRGLRTGGYRQQTWRTTDGYASPQTTGPMPGRRTTEGYL